MAEIDAGLVEWTLDQAKRNGATAVEVLCVSAESLAAGVRLGEVEKLKSSRERRLGIRIFVGQSSAMQAVYRVIDTVAPGKASVFIAPDGYTYRTKDGSLAAHFEHTILVDNNETLILTKRPSED